MLARFGPEHPRLQLRTGVAPLLRRGLAVAACTIALAACSIGETTYETVTYPARKQPQAATICEPPFAKPDLGKLEACMDGKGHCYDKTKVPMPDELEACDGDTVCVPNKVLAAAGSKLKSCTFLGGKPGACIELAVPRILQFKDALQKDVCEDDERCVPCINPEDGSPTPFCDDIGVYEEPCAAGGAAGATATCCHGAGVCMLAEVLDGDQRESLERDLCPEKRLCVPASQADGKPVKCEILGADGVCIDLCFADIIKGAQIVMRSGCGPTEVCMPCAIGKTQGMLGCE